jgi:hypothetical protein
MSIAFPLKLLHEQNLDWNVVGNTKGSGQTATSSVDVRSDGGGFVTFGNNVVQANGSNGGFTAALGLQ